MAIDLWLFDLINGWAGRAGALDAIARVLAVYGLWGVLAGVLAVVWWAPLDVATRWRLVGALALAAMLCGVLYGLEWWVTTDVLHHELRSRPANARWATLLITESTRLSFPAWPVVVAFALSAPLLRVLRRPGWVLCGLSSVLAFALVFVGVQYPFDVLTGLFTGLVLGLTAIALTRLHAVPGWRLAAVWALLVVWGGVLVLTIRPASEEGLAGVNTHPATSVHLDVPPAVMTTLQPLAPQVHLEAATNGHLQVAALAFTLPSPEVTLDETTTLARRGVNTLFARWPEIDLLTVTVNARFSRETGEKVGTLYTATLSRQQWPAGGFTAHQPLPGRKFFHPRFYAR